MRAPELLLRAVLATAVAVLAGLGFGARACAALQPLFRTVIEACVPGVVVRGLDVIHQGGVDLLVAVMVPLQSATAMAISPGTMLVSVTVGGTLVPAQVALAVALAWPVASGREAGVRGITLVVLLPLLMLGGPLTLAAEGLDTLRELSGRAGVSPMMVMSRQLMGGGAAALGLAAGIMAVLLGRRSDRQRAVRPVVTEDSV